MYKPHPFQIHNYLKDINYPDFEENWNEQVKSMDPDKFIELAEENYKGKIII